MVIELIFVHVFFALADLGFFSPRVIVITYMGFCSHYISVYVNLLKTNIVSWYVAYY